MLEYIKYNYDLAAGEIKPVLAFLVGGIIAVLIVEAIRYVSTYMIYRNLEKNAAKVFAKLAEATAIQKRIATESLKGINDLPQGSYNLKDGQLEKVQK